MFDVLVKNARLLDYSDVVDIGISNGLIESINPAISTASSVIDATDLLVLSGFVNAHIHLDKCLLADRLPQNRSGSIQESIALTWKEKDAYTKKDIQLRASQVIETAILTGTSAMRAFADVDPIGGLLGVESLLELKETYRTQIELQVTSYPQEGIFRQPGTGTLMEQAMELGADVVGGVPAYERSDEDMRRHVDFCFDLAEHSQCDVHFLADDTDSPTARSLEYIALRTIERGFHGRVTAGHCGALASYDHVHAADVIAAVREGQISICSNPHISLVLMGREDRGIVRRGITRVRELVDAGVNVLAAQDDVADPFYPFGRPDQLEVAQYMAHVAHLTSATQFRLLLDMVSANAARAMRLDRYGLQPGCRASLVAVQVPSLSEALREIPPRAWVMFEGRVVAESALESRLLD